jgi:transglutaminase-like putative cysteine protease
MKASRPARRTGRRTRRRSTLRGLGLVLGGVSALTVAFTAAAQVIGSRPVLHLDVPPPGEATDVASQPSQPLFGPDPGEGQNPSAFAYRNKILPAPQTGPEPTEDEPVHGRDGVAVDRITESKPDGITNADDTLQYVEIFNPAVLPFKRMSALDTVRGDYTLYTDSPETLQDLPVGGSPSPDRDLFWGDLVVELGPGQDVALPSVAPDMRIISYEVEPRTTVKFSKDGADNYFVRSDESGAGGTYRLRFMVDAPATYFAPAVPSNLRVDQVASRAPEGLLKPLPPNVQSVVGKALQRLNIDSSMPLRRALNGLVHHFREFEAGVLSKNSKDIYLDLVNEQVGVCRHRAFAFMVTANGLGIPTRYVTNEAHAWVEVWLPDVNWVRIDLGGAALRMVVENAQDKSVYQPRSEDPFVKPPGYESNYTQLEGEISGLSDEQKAEGREVASALDSRTFNSGPAPTMTGEDPRNMMIGPGTELPQLAPEAMENKRRTRLSVEYVDANAFRGETMTVRGRLVSEGKGLGGQRVDIYLAPDGRGGNEAHFIDRTVTEPNGEFTVFAQVPAELDLQGYEVFASTPGDSRFALALSD